MDETLGFGKVADIDKQSLRAGHTQHNRGDLVPDMAASEKEHCVERVESTAHKHNIVCVIYSVWHGGCADAVGRMCERGGRGERGAERCLSG